MFTFPKGHPTRSTKLKNDDQFYNKPRVTYLHSFYRVKAVLPTIVNVYYSGGLCIFTALKTCHPHRMYSVHLSSIGLH